MDPLILMIEPDLDERAAQATMSRAQRVYEDGARDISRVMREQLTGGFEQGGRAAEEMSDKARRAYLSMQDAAEKVAREERKLDAAREKGSSNTEAIARRVERARLDEVQAINRARDAYNDYDQSVNRSTRASVAFREGFRTGINNAVSDVTGRFGVFGDTATSVFSTLSPMAAGVAVGVAGIGAAALVVGKQLYDLGTTWDDVTDGISARTGMVGAELDAITASVERVASGVAIPLETVGDIAGQTAQSLHLSGAPLDAMIKQLSELTEITGEAVNIRDLGKLYRVFGVDAGAMPKVLDDLYTASTNSGRSVNDLVESALKGAPALSAFGLSIGSSTGLISLLEEAGVDSGAAVGAMTIALKKFADAGLEPQRALRDTITQIKALNDSGNQVGAIDLAQTTFGRGFAPIFEAIRSGTVDAQALTDTLTGSTKPSIHDMAESTRDAAEAFKMLKNTVEIEFAPAAKSAFEDINQLLTEMMGTLTNIANGNWGSAFSGIWDDLTDPFTSPNAPWRKWFGDGTPPPPNDPRSGLPGPQANAPANSRDSGGVPDFSIDPATGLPRSQANAPASSRDSGGLPPGMVPPAPGTPGGPPLLLPTEKGSKSLPDAPVLPLQYTSTAGLPSGIANATTRLDEVRHDVAEKEARVNQLQQSNVATAQDIQKAKNDLAKAQQDQMQAERALTDARINAAKQAQKQLGKLSDDLDVFGNKLDADFGISKGLGGIVENFVKAAGNILAAPFLQALGLISKANPNEGSGLIGIGAANGLFGSQYTPAALAAAQNAGGVPGYYRSGGYPGDAALLSMVPKGIGQYDNVTKDLSKGLVDCASGVEDLVNILDGKSTAGGSLWTGNAASVLPSMGFQPGMGGPGDFRIGYNSGHMQATLPGGANVNFGSTEAIRAGGLDGGAGAYDKSFTDHWYRPMAGATVATSPDIYGPANTDPGLTNPSAPDWGTPGIPSTIRPGGGQGPIFGANPQGPGIGASAGTGLGAGGGGQAYPSHGGNSGNIAGGLPLDAAMAATSVADMMMPGAGAMAKIGVQLANRTVGYVAQNAGIAANGLMETFSIGDNPRGGIGNSWLGKLAGGLAGAAPALPNLAGKKPPGPMNQATGQQQGNTTTISGDTNINVQAREGASGQEHGEQVAAETSRMYAPAGRQ